MVNVFLFLFLRWVLLILRDVTDRERQREWTWNLLDCPQVRLDLADSFVLFLVSHQRVTTYKVTRQVRHGKRPYVDTLARFDDLMSGFLTPPPQSLGTYILRKQICTMFRFFLLLLSLGTYLQYAYFPVCTYVQAERERENKLHNLANPG